MNHLEWDTLVRTRDALLAAKHGTKGAVIAAACQALQCDEQTVYRKLKEAGLKLDRKKRSDSGETAYSKEQLQLVAGLLVESTRRNAKRLLTVEDAVEILHADGHLPVKLSAGRVSQLLKEHNMHPDQLTHMAPATTLRSLHPNHVWQLDASICVLFYLKGQKQLQSMPADEFYKNKPHNLAKVINELCTRYVMSDHTTSVVASRYYTGGETAENLIEFFLWCVTQKDFTPVHGVPWMVMLDPGAANTSHLFKNLCERLRVTLQINLPGNPRAKGQVENAQNLVERHFEGRLPFLDSIDLERLNSLNELWQADFNSSRKHTRHGRTRWDAWMRITPEQLRIAPPMELLRDLVTTVEETRRVSNTATISYAVKGHGRADYDVRHVPGVMVGQQVTVVVNPYRAPAIDVQYTDQETGEVSWVCVEPIKVDENGFPVTAPVIGESYQALPHTVADENRKAIAKAAFGVDTLEEAEKARKARRQAFPEVNVMADIESREVPTYLPRRGTELDTARRSVAMAPLTVLEAAKRLRAALGEAYPTTAYAWLQERFGAEGVPEEQLEAIAAQLRAPVAPAAPAQASDDAPRLRVVAGGGR